MQTLGFAMCGSFCTLDKAMEQLAKLRKQYDLMTVMSENVYETDTRFGRAADFIGQAQEISGKPVLHTIVQTEPIGPKRLVDAMVVCPCTGNTLSKLALGITDTPVTMAVKSSLRVGMPVVICLASNDALAASGQNLARLMNTKNVYFVPLRQDDPVKKPFSLVADFSLLEDTVEAALQGRQLQPVYRCV
ncbi:dipicolinate synthase subunit B [Acutalibacter caecimuris]|uniref:dipicolinate synthase subunit B n=1 Tax=Acutalibacter caecimuris TaxID=3093657 RepID=UPI002AC8C7E5|nr:dipicolinate synthase subunit B [Acutalibacter sp. M00118]